MFSDLAELLFPPTCVACGRVLPFSAPFCRDCHGRVERLPDEICSVCAEPGVFESARCPRCVASPPPFAHAFAPFVHDGAIARAIHQFKYEDHPELAPRLAALLADEASAFLEGVEGVLCAIPLHRSRLWKRRYDQAALLTGALARCTGRTCVDGLVRARRTQRQVGLSEASRVANVADAFVARGRLRGLDVVLVDDVFTTGATARAAAGAALKVGARSVAVLTLARAYSAA